MTTPNASAGPQQAAVDAALVVLKSMGLSLDDLTAAPRARAAVPTFAEYVPVVSAAVTDGTRKAYGTYWNRVVEHWGGRHLVRPLPADTCVLLGSDQLRDVLLRACWPHYDLAAPILARMLRARAAATAPGAQAADLEAAAGQAAYNAAMIIAVAACRHPQATKLTRKLLRKRSSCRRGIVTALAQVVPPVELTEELIGMLTQLFDDRDDDIARLAGAGLRNIPDGNDDLARSLLSAACRSRNFILAPPQVILAAEHYQGNISETVFDIAERFFFQLHASQANNPSGHGFHDASVLGRLVISIYDQEPPASQLASRALNLIDAMILARTYGLEERMAQLDR